MKRQILQALIIIGGLFFFNSISGATIVFSKHDFTPEGGSTFRGSSSQVCVYCHTPHGGISNADGVNLPLWNRTLNDSGSFTMYGGYSATFDAAYESDGKPTGPSLLCLSCHDGVTTIFGDSILKHGSTPITAYDPADDPETIGEYDFPPWADVNIGTDLSDDHPVSFVYSPDLANADGALKAPGDIPADLRLPGGRVECTTCHNPHEYGTASGGTTPFLRMSNKGSAMCLGCHIK